MTGRRESARLRPRLYIYRLRQDDPHKCTSGKLLRFGYATPIARRRNIHRGCILLNPFSDSILTPLDKGLAEKHGIIALDCSWSRVSEAFSKPWRGVHRRLPLLLPGNPVSYGKPGRLSSLEALAAALIILSYDEDAQRILRLYKWGATFLDLNRSLFEAYKRSSEEEDIRRIEEETLKTRLSGKQDHSI
ncbi:MAG: DUF367 family protein [Candidatus Bathyarchaeia archaeon]